MAVMVAMAVIWGHFGRKRRIGSTAAGRWREDAAGWRKWAVRLTRRKAAALRQS
jgi:hypothetical protein